MNFIVFNLTASFIAIKFVKLVTIFTLLYIKTHYCYYANVILFIFKLFTWLNISWLCLIRFKNKEKVKNISFPILLILFLIYYSSHQSTC